MTTTTTNRARSYATLAAVASAALIAASGCAPDRVEDFEVTDVSHLAVGNGAGVVDIQAADTDAVTVHAEIYGRDVRLVHYVEDGVLTVESDIDWPCDFCRIDLTITVPRDLSVEVDAGSGDVLISDLEADLTASTGSGDVEIAGLSAESLFARSGSGAVRATGVVVSEAEARAGSGHLSLAFDGAPETLSASSGSGDLRISVPCGAYDVDWEAHDGRFDFDGIVLDPSAPSSMQLRSGSGDITLMGR